MQFCTDKWPLHKKILKINVFIGKINNSQICVSKHTTHVRGMCVYAGCANLLEQEEMCDLKLNAHCGLNGLTRSVPIVGYNSGTSWQKNTTLWLICKELCIKSKYLPYLFILAWILYDNIFAIFVQFASMARNFMVNSSYDAICQ